MQFIDLFTTSKDEFDIAILAKIECGFNSSEYTCPKKKPAGVKKRQKVRIQYLHKGQTICKVLWLYLHCIGKDKLEAYIKHYRLNGVETRIHKNTKKRPAKSLAYGDTRRVVDFVINFSEIHGYKLPGRSPKHWVTDPMLLPTNVTKKTVYDEYQKLCEDSGYRCVKYRTFRHIWQHLCPFVTTQMPATDLCWTCQNLNYRIASSSNLADTVKEQMIEERMTHQALVKQERMFYKETLDDTTIAVEESGVEPPLSNHISFDFAQQIHYPFDPLQPGPIFFKTPRKCGIFGVNSEPLSQQINYLIDEAHSCGKGANTVISYIHHYLENYSIGELHIKMHADNCSGQNKNSFVIWYLLWRTLSGLHEQITLSFLIAGHTKFSPDAGFGLFKKKLRKTKVDCLDDIAKCVSDSSKLNVPVLVGRENGLSDVKVYDWSSFFALFFKKVTKVLSYHHFYFDGTPHVAMQKDSASKEIIQTLVKKNSDGTFMMPSGFPDVVVPDGLSLQRQWYLYKEIRQFVTNDEMKDIVCPKPLSAEPTQQIVAEESDSDDEAAPPPPKKRSGRGRPKP